MHAMNVAVIDVGSNTIRMLVARREGDVLVPVAQRRARVGLGADVERNGRISGAKLREAAERVRAYADEARRLGSARTVVVAASPGRQAANAGELIRLLAQAGRVAVRVLSPEEEGALAFDGALAAIRPPEGLVAVCDVGGGSTQLAVGTRDAGPVWIRSIDIGSLRLTTRSLPNDPPGKKAMTAARAVVAAEFAGLAPPLPASTYAVGGSARALAKIWGPVLGSEELREALRLLQKRPSGDVAKDVAVAPARASMLAAGALILAEVQTRLGTPLQVVRAGLREGVALSLLAEASAA